MRKLEVHPHVLKIRRKADYLKVIFDTGISEYWALNYRGLKKPRAILLPFNREHFNNYLIPTYKQFEVNQALYPEEYDILKDHFIIKKTDLNKAGWCDVRFKIHDLTVELVEEGYIAPKYTEEILLDDYQELLNKDIKYYQQGLIRFSAFGNGSQPAGRRLIMHFMPCISENKWEFEKIYRVTSKFSNRDITRESIVYRLAKGHHVIRHPAFHRAIFKQWCNVSGKNVYDLHPDWGFRALGVLSENGNYYCDSPELNHLKQLANFIGGKVNKPNLDYYDLIILNDVYAVKREKAHYLIKKYFNSAAKLMITIEKKYLNEFILRYKPKNVLRLHNDFKKATEDDYIIIIQT